LVFELLTLLYWNWTWSVWLVQKFSSVSRKIWSNDVINRFYICFLSKRWISLFVIPCIFCILEKYNETFYNLCYYDPIAYYLCYFDHNECIWGVPISRCSIFLYGHIIICHSVAALWNTSSFVRRFNVDTI